MTASAPMSGVSAPACTNGASADCKCGAEEQTVGHIILQWLYGPTVLDDDTTKWLLNTCPEI